MLRCRLFLRPEHRAMIRLHAGATRSQGEACSARRSGDRVWGSGCVAPHVSQALPGHHARVGTLARNSDPGYRHQRNCRRGGPACSTPASGGRYRFGALRSLRVSGQHQTRIGSSSYRKHTAGLVVSRAEIGFSAGNRLVGTLGLQRYWMATPPAGRIGPTARL